LSPSEAYQEPKTPVRRFRWHLPIWLVLLIAFGGVTIATTATVGLAFYVAGLRNTVQLVGEIGGAKLQRIEDAVNAQLRPAADQANYLANILAQGQIDPNDDGRMRDLLLGSLAAISQLEAVAFIAPDYRTIWATGKSETGEHFSQVINTGALQTMRQILAQAKDRGQPSWSAPLVVESGPKDAMLVAISPVVREGVFIGAIAAGASLHSVAEGVTAALGTSGRDYFVMTADGHVLFHSSLSLLPTPLPGQEVLPEKATFVDPVLRAMPWPPGENRDTLDDPDDPEHRVDFFLIDFEAAGVDRLAAYKEMRGYGQIPWIVGFYLSRAQAEAFATTLNRAVPFAVAMVAISLLVSLWVGRAISRPIRALAEGSRQIAKLQFDAVPRLSSHLTEIARAADAQSQMRNGLKWLSHYIPKSLVPILMRSEEVLRSRDTDVVVLFSDIVGFSKIAEGRQADRIADLLNRHFSLLGRCIEAEGGTIDKYIGDSVMAFWGAPKAELDYGRRAQRAAAQIAINLAADNRRRAVKGLRPIRIRIGLHRGPAVVGNIGAPGRVNFTLIGDTVNIAQRLEQFGTTIDDGKSDAIVVASAEAIVDCPPEIEWIPLGSHVLAGRSTPTELFQLRLK